MKKYIFILLFICISGAVYAQRKVVEVETEPTSQSETARMLKRKVAIGRFSNETQYAKGLFYDKENDPMGKQALRHLIDTTCRIRQVHLIGTK